MTRHDSSFVRPELKPMERRRSSRVALQIPLQLIVEGVAYVAQTVLASRDGVMIHSPTHCA